MKCFIITIDTEGDNLWEWKPGDVIKTENTKYLNRFQELCQNYGFKPTWLTNFEMISDPQYVNFITSAVSKNAAELGMHLHAVNSLPLYDLEVVNNVTPYLIEYPSEIMEQKIDTLTKTIINNSGIKPITHRAGRWATNDIYMDLLAKYGYIADCSVTPHIDWSGDVGQTINGVGSDYRKNSERPYKLKSGIWEIPVTIIKTHKLFVPEIKSGKKFLRMAYRMVKGQNLWLRPQGDNLKEMQYILKNNYYENKDYVMFMMHSSEMMPGGSPTFKNEDSIGKMYKDVEEIFKLANELGYVGVTLSDYARMCK